MRRRSGSAETSDPTALAAERPVPAGAVRRLIATVLDMAIYCGLCFVLALPVSRAIDLTRLSRALEDVSSTVADPAWISHASGILGMWIAIWWCYFVVGWGLFGATPGKWAAGIRLVDHKDRGPIGLSRAMMRLVAYSVSSVTLGLGHLLVVFRSDRRALHDLLAGTRVIRARRGV